MNNSIECCENVLTQSIIDQLRNTYGDKINVDYYENSMHAYTNAIVCDKCGTTSKIYYRNEIFGYDVAEEVGVNLPDTIEAGWYTPKADEDWHDFATALGDVIDFAQADGSMIGLLFVVDNLVFQCTNIDDYLEDTVELIATIEDDVMIKLKQGDHVDILQYLPGIKEYINTYND